MKEITVRTFRLEIWICMSIMDSKSPLLDELVKRVNNNLEADNTDTEDDSDDYSSDEDEFDDELFI